MRNFMSAFRKKLLAPNTMISGPFESCSPEDKETITSIDAMRLVLRGMRGSSVYEIADERGITELRLYREVFRGGEVVLELEESAAYAPAVFIELMNLCCVMRWDGFHGAHPKHVSDGIMFDFTAVVNGGQRIRADGSENFPQGYREFVRELNRMLAEREDHGDRGDCDGS